MKSKNFFSVINTLLLGAMLVFIILIYNNSKDCCKDESKNESIEKTFNEKIDSLSKELNILKLGVDSLKKNCCNEIKAIPIPAKKEVVTNHRMEQLKKERDYFKRKFETPEPKKEVAEVPAKEKEAVEKKDSSHVVVEEYYKDDTLTYLDVYYKNNLYYYHKYPNYSSFNKTIIQVVDENLSWKVKDFLNWKTVSGAVATTAGSFIPKKTRLFSNDINIDIGGTQVNNSTEHINKITPPLKTCLIVGGSILILNGILDEILGEVKCSKKILKNVQLEISACPTGISIKAKH